MKQKEFLKSLKAAAKAAPWNEESPEVLGMWLNASNLQINRIKSWLEPAEEAGYIQVKKTIVSLEERQYEEYAQYVANGLTVSLPGRNFVRIEPVARFVIGAIGRIDIRWGASRVSLLRIQGDEWKMLSEKVRAKIDWDKEELYELLAEITHYTS